MPELLVTSVALSDVDIEQFETCSRSTGNSKMVLMIKNQDSLVCSKFSIEVPNAIASVSHTTLGFLYSLSTYMSFSFPNKQRSHCRKQNWFFLSHLSVGRIGSYAPIDLKILSRFYVFSPVMLLPINPVTSLFQPALQACPVHRSHIPAPSHPPHSPMSPLLSDNMYRLLRDILLFPHPPPKVLYKPT